jgi:hypothetical protein
MAAAFRMAREFHRMSPIRQVNAVGDIFIDFRPAR